MLSNYWLKESVIPSAGNKFIFIIAPGITFFLSLIGWAVIPFSNQNIMSDIDFGCYLYFCYFLFRRLWYCYVWMGE
jgi:NADH-quinone oxidoreductase subunit H